MPTLRRRLNNLLNADKYLKQFTPTAQKNLLSEYRNSLGLPDTIDLGAKAFEEHETKKVHDHTSFKTQLGSNKEDTLENQLKDDTAEKKAVREKFAELFKAELFYTNAKETYAETLDAFKKKIKEVPEKYTVEDIRSELERVQANAKNAIKAQHIQEKKKFEAALNDAEFMKTFCTALGGKTEGEADTIKKDLLAELDKTHAAQFSEFEKTAQKNLTVLDEASAKEMDRLIFSAHLEKTSRQLSPQHKQEMLAEIGRVRAKNKAARGSEENTEVLMDVKEGTISAINPNDLNFIISLTGQKIVHENNRWSVKMSSRIFSPGYYLSAKENPKTDMMEMAKLVRASGFDGISMTVNFNDPKTQKQRARQAYEACLDTGFPPERIKLKDGSGKEIKLETLFTPGELVQLNANSQNTRKQLEEIKKNIPSREANKERVNEMRGELLELRNAARTAKDKNAAPLTKEQMEKDEQDIKAVINP